MATLLIMSVLFATVLIPLWAAREPSARRGYKRTVLGLCVFNALYLVALLVLYRHLL